MTKELNADETALLVIDMQNDFAHEDGALYAPGSELAEPAIGVLQEAFRTAGAEVIFTRDTHTETQYDDAHYYDEFEQWGEHVLDGSWGHEIVDSVAPEDGEKIIDKSTYDAFHKTGLDAYLRRNDIKNLVIVGTLANVCVLHTASSAGLRDYRPILVEEAIGAIEDSDREYALEHADWLFGERVEHFEDIELITED